MLDRMEPPKNVEELRGEIVKRHEHLSKRLQQIARYVLDEPHDVAFETLAVIGSRCGVQPSAVVRFAKSFGFDGASQMQKLFRDDLLNARAGLTYPERVRQISHANDDVVSAPNKLLEEFVEGSRLALANLYGTVSQSELAAASDLIEKAQSVSIVGFRRSFPVASYLAYSLLQAGKRTHFIDGVAGLAIPHIATLGPSDLLIAVSYHPYAEETVTVTSAAARRRVPIIAITDSAVSPIAKPANQCLLVRDAEVRGFRSLATSMCLAQALAITFAMRSAAKSQPAASAPEQK